MIWLVVAVGLRVAAFGATAGAALITVSRAELTRAVGRRLRGAAPSLAWLNQIDYYLTAASATTSLGVLLVGAAHSRAPGGLGRAPRCRGVLALLGGAAGALRGLPGAPLAHAARGPNPWPTA